MNADWDLRVGVPKRHMAWCEHCKRILHIKHSCEYMSVSFDTGDLRNHAKWNMGSREYDNYMVDLAREDGRQIVDEKDNLIGATAKEAARTEHKRAMDQERAEHDMNDKIQETIREYA